MQVCVNRAHIPVHAWNIHPGVYEYWIHARACLTCISRRAWTWHHNKSKHKSAKRASGALDCPREGARYSLRPGKTDMLTHGRYFCLQVILWIHLFTAGSQVQAEAVPRDFPSLHNQGPSTKVRVSSNKESPENFISAGSGCFDRNCTSHQRHKAWPTQPWTCILAMSLALFQTLCNKSGVTNVVEM